MKLARARGVRFALVVIIVILAAAGWRLCRVTQPVYAGRPLIHWIHQGYGSSHVSASVQAKAHLYADAGISHLGTNPLPIYIRWLKSSDSPLETGAFRLAGGRTFLRLDSSLLWAENRRLCAYVALSMLGPQATGAVPDLQQILLEHPAAEKEPAAILLATIGPESIPFLTAALTNSDPDVRASAAYGLAHYGATDPPWGVTSATNSPAQIASAAELVVPALIQSLKDPAPRVRRIAAGSLRSFAQVDTVVHAIIGSFVSQLQDQDADIRFVATENLGWLKRDPELVVPALAAMLQQDQPEIRLAAAIALGEYGTNAALAKPALEKAAAEDSDPKVRTLATMALTRLTPR